MYEYFKGAMNEAHRACDRVALGENDPAVKQFITGDCSESQLQGLHDKQIDWCKNEGAWSRKSLSPQVGVPAREGPARDQRAVRVVPTRDHDELLQGRRWEAPARAPEHGGGPRGVYAKGEGPLSLI